MVLAHVFIVLFIIIVECTLSTHITKQKFGIKQYAILLQQQPNTACANHLSRLHQHHFPLVLDLTSRSFVEEYTVQVVA